MNRKEIMDKLEGKPKENNDTEEVKTKDISDQILELVESWRKKYNGEYVDKF